MRAVGLARRTSRRRCWREGLAVAAVGSLLGVAAGVGYAWLMLVGLSTWWLGAISTPFLELYVSPRSMLIGFLARRDRLAADDRLDVAAAGAAVACADCWPARPRTIARRPARRRGAAGGRRWACWSRRRAAAGAAALVGRRGAGRRVRGFGRLVLAAGLTFIWSRLRGGDRARFERRAGLPIARLAVRNGARNPGRSTLSIGLIAAASFLIVALTRFRLDPAAEGRGRDSGSGGFNLVAQSDQPIYQDLDAATARPSWASRPTARGVARTRARSWGCGSKRATTRVA